MPGVCCLHHTAPSCALHPAKIWVLLGLGVGVGMGMVWDSLRGAGDSRCGLGAGMRQQSTQDAVPGRPRCGTVPRWSRASRGQAWAPPEHVSLRDIPSPHCSSTAPSPG